MTGLALPFETEACIGSMHERFARGSVQSSGEAILNRQHHRAVPWLGNRKPCPSRSGKMASTCRLCCRKAATIRGVAVVDSGAYHTGLSVREHDISGVREPVPWWMF